MTEKPSGSGGSNDAKFVFKSSTVRVSVVKKPVVASESDKSEKPVVASESDGSEKPVNNSNVLLSLCQNYDCDDDE